MCTYRKAIPLMGMQLHAMSLHTIWSISFSFLAINKCQSGIDFFLLASEQYNSSLMNKILARPGAKYFEKYSNTLQLL